MAFWHRLFGRKPRDRRVQARLRVTIGSDASAYWTEDVALGGIRVNIGRRLSLGDLTGGSRDVVLSLELDDGDVRVHAEPIWTVRTDEGNLTTGWMFTTFEEDGESRLQAFIERA